jgi:tetratricopeptide (TPR) repeat protein
VFERGLFVYPDCHEVLNYLAYMCAERNIELDKSLAYIKRALELEPENGAYRDTLGWIFYRLKRFREALSEIQTASRLLPEDPVILEHLGDVSAALNDKDDAVYYWKESYQKDPKSPSVARKLQAEGVDLGTLPESSHPALQAP